MKPGVVIPLLALAALAPALAEDAFGQTLIELLTPIGNPATLDPGDHVTGAASLTPFSGCIPSDFGNWFDPALPNPGPYTITPPDGHTSQASCLFFAHDSDGGNASFVRITLSQIRDDGDRDGVHGPRDECPATPATDGGAADSDGNGCPDLALTGSEMTLLANRPATLDPLGGALGHGLLVTEISTSSEPPGATALSPPLPAAGPFTYSPDDGYAGVITFGFTVRDSQGNEKAVGIAVEYERPDRDGDGVSEADIDDDGEPDDKCPDTPATRGGASDDNSDGCPDLEGVADHVDAAKGVIIELDPLANDRGHGLAATSVTVTSEPTGAPELDGAVFPGTGPFRYDPSRIEGQYTITYLGDITFEFAITDSRGATGASTVTVSYTDSDPDGDGISNVDPDGPDGPLEAPDKCPDENATNGGTRDADMDGCTDDVMIETPIGNPVTLVPTDLVTAPGTVQRFDCEPLDMTTVDFERKTRGPVTFIPHDGFTGSARCNVLVSGLTAAGPAAGAEFDIVFVQVPDDGDGDGVHGPLDRCPDLQGIKPHGCTADDRDGDGKPNVAGPDGTIPDRCPDAAPGAGPAADADDDGCPDNDRDGDGHLNHDDGCPDAAPGAGPAADTDGDGCPDNDTDGDGVPNSTDTCPDRAGTEANGCPDSDRDGDGRPNVAGPDGMIPDRCPDTAPGTGDAADLDEDGCPDNDRDGDGHPNNEDGCPEAAPGTGPAADTDGDGCPDNDTDGDNVPNDGTDACPGVFGTEPNGCTPADRDGDGKPNVAGPDGTIPDRCPDAAPGTGDAADTNDDGCPDNDVDGDGVPNNDDACRDLFGTEPNGCTAEDRDGDGIPNGPDRCPDAAPGTGPAADTDGDGCPDNDPDGDGVVNDGTDACPNLPGTLPNGCTPADRDGDGRSNEPGPDGTIPDRCPDTAPGTGEAADRNGDGCPDNDRDGDGRINDADACPDAAGTEPNGCPAGDRDGDGVPNNSDSCPDTHAGAGGADDADGDGCPDDDPDGDGIVGGADSCPAHAGRASNSGCPLSPVLATPLDNPVTFDPRDYTPAKGDTTAARCIGEQLGTLTGPAVPTRDPFTFVPADPSDLPPDAGDGTGPTECLFTVAGGEGPPSSLRLLITVIEEDPDGDGLHGALDACPRTHATAGGAADADANGCPDPDNDGDGVVPPADACPELFGTEPNGCTPADRDGDGLPNDGTDRCPDAAPGEGAAADVNGDGCPDDDPDGDGVAGGADRCPALAGSNAVGCPDTITITAPLGSRAGFQPLDYVPDHGDGEGDPGRPPEDLDNGTRTTLLSCTEDGVTTEYPQRTRNAFTWNPRVGIGGQTVCVATVTHPGGGTDTVTFVINVVADDPDGDGRHGPRDRCPDYPGTEERLGCPASVSLETPIGNPITFDLDDYSARKLGATSGSCQNPEAGALAGSPYPTGDPFTFTPADGYAGQASCQFFVRNSADSPTSAVLLNVLISMVADDPDGDGVHGGRDRCPADAGPDSGVGCPGTVTVTTPIGNPVGLDPLYYLGGGGPVTDAACAPPSAGTIAGTPPTSDPFTFTPAAGSTIPAQCTFTAGEAVLTMSIDQVEDDSDGDGVHGVLDMCPATDATAGGASDADSNGCPDSDNDGDGIEPPADRCPEVAAATDDGCPDDDPDGDGVPNDGTDKCPAEHATSPPSGTFADTDLDGCPDIAQRDDSVTVPSDSGRVFFRPLGNDDPFAAWLERQFTGSAQLSVGPLWVDTNRPVPDSYVLAFEPGGTVGRDTHAISFVQADNVQTTDVDVAVVAPIEPTPIDGGQLVMADGRAAEIRPLEGQLGEGLFIIQARTFDHDLLNLPAWNYPDTVYLSAPAGARGNTDITVTVGGPGALPYDLVLRVTVAGDADNDGVLDPEDACPTTHATRNAATDGDGDGCPDNDSDGDGIIDTVDKCPLVPGPQTGLTGCPDVIPVTAGFNSVVEFDPLVYVDDGARTGSVTCTEGSRSESLSLLEGETAYAWNPLVGIGEQSRCDATVVLNDASSTTVSLLITIIADDPDGDGVHGTADACPGHHGEGNASGCPDAFRLSTFTNHTFWYYPYHYIDNGRATTFADCIDQPGNVRTIKPFNHSGYTYPLKFTPTTDYVGESHCTYRVLDTDGNEHTVDLIIDVVSEDPDGDMVDGFIDKCPYVHGGGHGVNGCPREIEASVPVGNPFTFQPTQYVFEGGTTTSLSCTEAGRTVRGATPTKEPFTFTPTAGAGDQFRCDFTARYPDVEEISRPGGSTAHRLLVTVFADDGDSDGLHGALDRCPEISASFGGAADRNGDGCPDTVLFETLVGQHVTFTPAQYVPANGAVTSAACKDPAAGSLEGVAPGDAVFTFSPAPAYTGDEACEFRVADEDGTGSDLLRVTVRTSPDDPDGDGVHGALDLCPGTPNDDGGAVDDRPRDGCPDIDVRDYRTSWTQGHATFVDPLGVRLPAGSEPRALGHGLEVTAITVTPEGSGAIANLDTKLPGPGPFVFSPAGSTTGDVEFGFTIRDSQNNEDTSTGITTYEAQDRDGDGLSNTSDARGVIADKCPDTHANDGDLSDADPNDGLASDRDGDGCPDIDAVTDTATAPENRDAVLDPLANDHGHGLEVTGIAFEPAGGGSLDATAGTGPFTFTPATGFTGDVDFTYEVLDGRDNTGTGAMLLTYTEDDADDDGVNDADDACPAVHAMQNGAIDMDGDGCPDDDADSDGLAGAADKCPMAHANDGNTADDVRNDGRAVDAAPRDGCPDLEAVDEEPVTAVRNGVIRVDPLANDLGHGLQITVAVADPPGAVFLSEALPITGPFELRPDTDQLGDVTLTFTVRDSQGARDESTMVVTYEEADRDGDGKDNDADKCPDTAADTADGCPEGDRDGDGRGDGDDRCPDTPATRGGASDASPADGCPDIAAVADRITADRGEAVVLNPLANDLGHGLTAVSVTSVSAPSGAPQLADFVSGGAGPFTYTPAPGYVGVVTFSFAVADSQNNPGTSTVELTYVEFDNDGDGVHNRTDRCPETPATQGGAVDDSPRNGCPDIALAGRTVMLHENTAAAHEQLDPLIGALGHGLTVVSVSTSSEPEGATALSAALPGTGPFGYAPDEGYVGTVTFEFAVRDSQGHEDEVRIALEYAEVDRDGDGVLDTDTTGDGLADDRCPDAHKNDAITTDENPNDGLASDADPADGCPDLAPAGDRAVLAVNDVAALDPLNNDHGHGLEVISADTSSEPAGATALSGEFPGAGPFTYTPDPGYLGTITFTFTVRDSQGKTAAGDYVLEYADDDRDGDGVPNAVGGGEGADRCPDAHARDGDTRESSPGNDGTASDTNPRDGCPDLDVEGDTVAGTRFMRVESFDPFANDRGHGLEVVGVSPGPVSGSVTMAEAVPHGGSGTVTGPGPFTFTPAGNFIGEAAFTLTVRDSLGNEEEGDVLVRFEPDPGDGDGDGVPDGTDACPFEHATLGGNTDGDGDGCADDFDGDGVTRVGGLDRCPYTHATRGGNADGDGNGCPDLAGVDDTIYQTPGTVVTFNPLHNDLGHGLEATGASADVPDAGTLAELAPHGEPGTITGPGPFVFVPEPAFEGAVTLSFGIMDSQGNTGTSLVRLEYNSDDRDGDGVTNAISPAGTDADRCPDAHRNDGDTRESSPGNDGTASDTDPDDGCPDLEASDDAELTGISSGMITGFDPFANDRGHGLEVAGVSQTTDLVTMTPAAGPGPFTFAPAPGYTGTATFTLTIRDSLGAEADSAVPVTFAADPADRDGDGISNEAGPGGEIPDRCPDTHKNDAITTDGDPNDGLASDADPADGCPDLRVVEDGLIEADVNDNPTLDPLNNDHGHGLEVTGAAFAPGGSGLLAEVTPHGDPGTITGPGPFAFTPAADYEGEVTVTFEIRDSRGATGSGTQKIAFGDPDRDGDGYTNAIDACPDLHANANNSDDLDRNGCPDFDNDGDGKTTDADTCPERFGARENGCPDDDRDGDRVPNTDANGDGAIDDACPDLYGTEPNGCTPADRDGDGISNEAGPGGAIPDRCPDLHATAGGGTDGDKNGCPDSDNDGDGKATDVDACPERFGARENGCPDGDRDGDGVSNVDPDGGGPLEPADRCPDLHATAGGGTDGDTNGCPDSDNDGDGVPNDGTDACPELFGTEPNGCTAEDRDGDGVPNDGTDACPDLYGTEPNGCTPADRDGDGVSNEPRDDGTVPDACPDLHATAGGGTDRDTNGCPDSDNDGDGVPNDGTDACPELSGTEPNGCTAADRDGDGISNEPGPDGTIPDRCPDRHANAGGAADTDPQDGCPDNDRDGDGILNGPDTCPSVHRNDGDTRESSPGNDGTASDGNNDGCPDLEAVDDDVAGTKFMAIESFDPFANDRGLRLQVVGVSPGSVSGSVTMAEAVPHGEPGTITGPGPFTFTPDGGYTGTETFTLTIRDSRGAEGTSDVRVTFGTDDADRDGDGVPNDADDCPDTHRNDAITTDGDPNDGLASDADPDDGCPDLRVVEDGLIEADVDDSVELDPLNNDHGHGLVVTSADTSSEPAGAAALPDTFPGAGPFTYTPDPGYLGTITFTFTIQDSQANEAEGTMTLTYADADGDGLRDAADMCPDTHRNDAITTDDTHNDGLASDGDGDGCPDLVAVDDGEAADPGAPVDLDPLANDHGHGLEVISADTSSEPAGASPLSGTFPGAGPFTYTPDPGYLGTITFTFTIRDSQGSTATAPYVLTYADGDGDGLRDEADACPDTHRNDADTREPNAVHNDGLASDTNPDDGCPDLRAVGDDAGRLGRNVDALLAPLENDHGYKLTVTGITWTPGGTGTINATAGPGPFLYTPAPDHVGTVTFTVTVRDGLGHEQTSAYGVEYINEDVDGDMISNDVDGCPDIHANDSMTGDGDPNDGLAPDNDGNGCPDHDNDGDGVPNDADRTDACPHTHATRGPDRTPGTGDDTRDGDGDGCPDGDGDGDGLPDSDFAGEAAVPNPDRCPGVHATLTYGGAMLDDGDGDGCPDTVLADDEADTTVNRPVEVDVLANDRGANLRITDISYGTSSGHVRIAEPPGTLEFTPAPGSMDTAVITVFIRGDGDGETHASTLTVRVGDTPGPGADDDGDTIINSRDACPHTHATRGPDGTAGTGDDAPDGDGDGCPDLPVQVSVADYAVTTDDMTPVMKNMMEMNTGDLVIEDFEFKGDKWTLSKHNATHVVFTPVDGEFTRTGDEVPEDEVQEPFVFVVPIALADDSDTFSSTLTVTVTDSDGDGDGVVDGADRCPATPDGSAVNKAGCIPPVARNDGVSTPRDTPLAVDPLENDDGEAKSVTQVTGTGTHGTLELSEGALTYTPNGDTVGTDTFTINVLLSHTVHSSILTVGVADTNGDGDPVPDLGDRCPDEAAGTDADGDGCTDAVIMDDVLATTRGSTVMLDPLSNDSGADLRVTAAAFDPPEAGSLEDGQVPGRGPFTFTAAGGFDGDVTFTFAISDGPKITNLSSTLVLTVFPGTEGDIDGDGVPDHMDRCPRVPAVTDTNNDGCTDAVLQADTVYTDADTAVSFWPLENDAGTRLLINGVEMGTQVTLAFDGRTVTATPGPGATGELTGAIVNVLDHNRSIPSRVTLVVSAEPVPDVPVAGGAVSSGAGAPFKFDPLAGEAGTNLSITGASAADLAELMPPSWSDSHVYVRAVDGFAGDTSMDVEIGGEDIEPYTRTIRVSILNIAGPENSPPVRGHFAPEGGGPDLQAGGTVLDGEPAHPGPAGEEDAPQDGGDGDAPQDGGDGDAPQDGGDGDAPQDGGDEHLERPTFGLDPATRERAVECGYSMDGQCRDVDEFHVDYERQVIETGSVHDFALKARGTADIRWFQLGLGVPEVGSATESAEALIHVEVAPDYGSEAGYAVERVEYRNGNGVIGEDAEFEAYLDRCTPEGPGDECVTLEMRGVLFREQMYAEPFVIFVMDGDRRTATHYMNDGLLVQGESLNPAPEHTMTERATSQGAAESITLQRTDKLGGIWEDGAGRVFTQNAAGTWIQLEGPPADMSSACTDADSRLCDAFAERLGEYNGEMERLRDSLFAGVYDTGEFAALADPVTIYDADGDSRTKFLEESGMSWLRG